MYYETTVIDGVLYSRTTPGGTFEMVRNPEMLASHYMFKIGDEARLNIMQGYCSGCGTTHMPCHCQNDE